nr:DMT family transporter [Corynebacterium macginleyi]
MGILAGLVLPLHTPVHTRLRTSTGTPYLFLCPRLSAVETVVLPIAGQVFMSHIVDHWGLFEFPKSSLTVLRWYLLSSALLPCS